MIYIHDSEEDGCQVAFVESDWGSPAEVALLLEVSRPGSVHGWTERVVWRLRGGVPEGVGLVDYIPLRASYDERGFFRARPRWATSTPC